MIPSADAQLLVDPVGAYPSPSRRVRPHVVSIVDDNPTNLEVLSAALDAEGFEVCVAMDGESAIEQAQAVEPDLILLDVMMPPGIDGFETCRRLKADPLTAAIPTIFMTARTDSSDKLHGLNMGAVDYITKPFDRDEVIARVRIHLQIRDLQQQLSVQNSLLRDFNQALEDKVQARTAELAGALAELRESQATLMEQEKMSALGKSISGIAHEINNPMSFIVGNLNHAQGYVADVVALIRRYQATFPDRPSDLVQFEADIDLDFLLDDLPSLLNSMTQGTTRIAQISRSMRIFSRADATSKVEFDLNDSVESTLLLLKYRLKANQRRPEIEVIKDLGNLRALRGFPGPLGQVLMNLMANAIDAIEEASEGKSYEEISTQGYCLTLRTYVLQGEEPEQDRLCVEVLDNGPGIPENVREHIFDKSFTTKPVGKGTGLGLHIAREIIEKKHNGEILCQSTLGKGTCFKILLPLE